MVLLSFLPPTLLTKQYLMQASRADLFFWKSFTHTLTCMKTMLPDERKHKNNAANHQGTNLRGRIPSLPTQTNITKITQPINYLFWPIHQLSQHRQKNNTANHPTPFSFSHTSKSNTQGTDTAHPFSFNANKNITANHSLSRLTHQNRAPMETLQNFSSTQTKSNTANHLTFSSFSNTNIYTSKSCSHGIDWYGTILLFQHTQK